MFWAFNVLNFWESIWSLNVLPFSHWVITWNYYGYNENKLRDVNKLVGKFWNSLLRKFIYGIRLLEVTDRARSNYRRCSVKERILKSLGNVTRKQLYWRLFLIKLQFSGLPLSKRASNIGIFLWNLQNVFRTSFVKHLWMTGSAWLRSTNWELGFLSCWLK